MNMIKRGQEDYLRLLYILGNTEGVRNVDIANKLKIKKSSVSEMLRKLHKQSLVNLKPYSKVFLTKKGETIAEKLFDRHITIKKFFKKFLHYEDNKASEEAHQLEHHFSEDTVKIMNEFVEGKKELNLPNYVG